ncbi:MAG: universal stress protein [Puia sp.]|nr:universal stress protein [Puia sp.]
MKTLLIATDFSTAARNATEYGLGLAGAFGAEIVLVSAYEQMPIPVIGSTALTSPDDMREIVRGQLEEEATKLITPATIRHEVLSRKGSTVAAILSAARDTNADLVIVGMGGSGKTYRKVFGSTATALAGKTPVALLVVPEGAAYAPPFSIAIASDVLREQDHQVPAIVLKLAERFQSKLYIIRIFSKQAGEVIEILHHSATSDSIVGSFSPLCEIPATNRVADALAQFISANPVSMLVMTPHLRSAPEQWFLRSNTRELIFKTGIPLLILPGDRHSTTPSSPSN